MALCNKPRTCSAACLRRGLSIACIDATGSTAAISVWLLATSWTTTLHGNIVPILSSSCNASYASFGLQAPRIRYIIAEINVNLCFERLFDVDLRENTEALALEGFGGPLHGFIETDGQHLAEVVTHRSLTAIPDEIVRADGYQQPKLLAPPSRITSCSPRR